MANARRGITRSPDSPVTAAISRSWRSASTLSRLITVFEESLEFLIPVEYRFLESLVLLILVEYRFLESLDFLLIPAECPAFQTHGMKDGNALTQRDLLEQLLRLRALAPRPQQHVDTITPLLKIIKDIIRIFNAFDDPS